MSFDLSFWHEDVQSTPERAAGFYDRIADGEDRVVPSVPAIGDFAAEAIALFGDLTEENIEASVDIAAVSDFRVCNRKHRLLAERGGRASATKVGEQAWTHDV